MTEQVNDSSDTTPLTHKCKEVGCRPEYIIPQIFPIILFRISLFLPIIPMNWPKILTIILTIISLQTDY